MSKDNENCNCTSISTTGAHLKGCGFYQTLVMEDKFTSHSIDCAYMKSGDFCTCDNNAPSLKDNIRPDYYNPADIYEPVKIIRALKLNFNIGNTLKYILRPCKAKTVAKRVEDLRKAQTYLEFEIGELLG